MRLDDDGPLGSDFEVQRGGGGGFRFPMGGGGFPLGGGSMGCGGLALLVVAALIFGINPLTLLGGGGGVPVQAPTQVSRDATGLTPIQTTSVKVLNSTRQVWTDLFREAGQTYQPTTLSFYSRQGRSGCGAAQSAMGPFYCPSDGKVYLDTDFFNELDQRMNVPGDFPIGYVIAHEVGHHIQNLTGVADQVQRAQAQGSKVAGNRLQVAMELQADCYAGVWANRARNRDGSMVIEPGDLEEGLRAAQAIGDDTLQRQSQGVVVPESFTHGTSAQRMEWLQRGFQTGDPRQCNTFGN